MISDTSHHFLIGIDVGSTTVKAVVMKPNCTSILWRHYERHETRQPEKVLEFIRRISAELGALEGQARIFMTGSGAAGLAPLLDAKFVQEVNAVSLAVETFHQDVGSVIELGGQDAKIIIWQTDPVTGYRRKLPSMNDRCAGGTGAVIDKICTKLQIPAADLATMTYRGHKLHPVAGKCGVFAETDINGLQKQGVHPKELMASLFEAIVQQNLSVLTRGNTLAPKVLLLGGPNTFIPGMVEAWKASIPKIWEERKTPLAKGIPPEDLIFVPSNAEYYAAIGAVLYGQEEPANTGIYQGSTQLELFISGGRVRALAAGNADRGLVTDASEYKQFRDLYEVRPPKPPTFLAGEVVQGWLGIDGGSTSTKGVVVNSSGDVLAQAYELSRGNPIADTKIIIKELKDQIEAHGAEFKIMGLGTTGYAKDMLKEVFGGDVALVETVAHMRAAVHTYKDVDVIVDVGGQDIKVIFVKSGVVKDFKLNTQCSAGNGYFLQNTAAKFGVPVSEFAERAFTAEASPIFSYGCAVFMESDIVNFQRLGWQAHEIMAGLAKVLPKNIWLYVVQEPNLRKFGTRFVLQGGTQRNLAAVKSQVDFIKERVPDANIRVHQYCGVSGAIGAAFEAIKVTSLQGHTQFISFEEAMGLDFKSKRDEETRCFFCKNQCLRTFIKSQTQSGRASTYIIATCEKGEVTDIAEMKKIRARMQDRAKSNPDLVDFAARRVFESFKPSLVAKPGWGKRLKKKHFDNILKQRAAITVGMPRTLNMFSLAPFFTAFLESLGVSKIIWSDYTSEKLYRDGAKRGSIDPCYPSKVAMPHVHNLVHQKKVDAIYFPSIITIPERLKNTKGSCACPTVQSAANVSKAGLTKETDLFKEKKIQYIDNALHMDEPNCLVKQMYESFVDLLSLDYEETRLAVGEGFKALEAYHSEMTGRGREVLTHLEATGKVGLLMIGRPYHHDPGLNHEILSKIQQCGYPILMMDSLDDAEEKLDHLFGDEMQRGLIQHPKDISDVFGNPYSANSNFKIWAAKYAARHPHLAVIDMSSFKCGMDAPIYHIIENILEATRTPYFTFHDIDENKPSGSIKIRVETIDYALRQYETRLKVKSIEPLRATQSELKRVNQA